MTNLMCRQGMSLALLTEGDRHIFQVADCCQTHTRAPGHALTRVNQQTAPTTHIEPGVYVAAKGLAKGNSMQHHTKCWPSPVDAGVPPIPVSHKHATKHKHATTTHGCQEHKQHCGKHVHMQHNKHLTAQATTTYA